MFGFSLDSNGSRRCINQIPPQKKKNSLTLISYPGSLPHLKYSTFMTMSFSKLFIIQNQFSIQNLTHFKNAGDVGAANKISSLLKLRNFLFSYLRCVVKEVVADLNLKTVLQIFNAQLSFLQPENKQKNYRYLVNYQIDLSKHW